MHKSDFQDFYQTYLDRVYRFLYFRLGGKREVAEDLTSEIFMSALKHYATYDPSKSTSAWIMTITRNRLANYWRDLKQNADVDELAPLLIGTDGRVEMVRTELGMNLKDLLGMLDAKDRQLIEYKYLLGYNYKEMGELFDRSAGALKVETHRVMKKLRVLIEERMPELAKRNQYV